MLDGYTTCGSIHQNHEELIGQRKKRLKMAKFTKRHRTIASILATSLHYKKKKKSKIQHRRSHSLPPTLTSKTTFTKLPTISQPTSILDSTLSQTTKVIKSTTSPSPTSAIMPALLFIKAYMHPTPAILQHQKPF